MELRDLRYFLACTELGQLQRAAQRVARTQPALTKSIRRLEAALDTRLFERDGRGLRLTAAGTVLAAHARKLLRGVTEAAREVAEVADGRAGHVRLGTGPTMAEWFLPQAFGRILAQMPDLTFTVRVGLGEELRRALREGELDFAILPLLEDDAGEFAVTPLCADEMVVAARPGHPLAGREVTCRALAGARWMLPTMTSLLWVQAAFARHAVAPPMVQMEVSSVLLLRRVLLRTDLLTFVSRRDLGGEPEVALHEVRCPELRLDRRFGVLSARDGFLAAAAQRTLRLLAQTAMPPGGGG